VSRLAYLLSKPGLDSKSGGSNIGRENWVAYVDAANAVSTLSLAGVPSGTYSGLSFQIGIDEAINQSDPNQYPANHPLNPQVNNLHWSPQGGYIFLALEGHASPRAFSWHLGNAGNQVVCEIPVEFELGRGTRIAIDFHLDRIFRDLSTQSQVSTHSREGDSLVGILKTRLEKAFSLREVSAVSEALSTAETELDSNLVGTPYRFQIKKGFPIPALPTDYPLTNERVELGGQLFRETALSRNNQISCNSCHQTEHAFTDSEQFSTGVEGRIGRRNSMPLLNLAWKREGFFWDGRAKSLRDQALIPIEDHLEMDESLGRVVGKLAKRQHYLDGFEKAFGTAEITSERIGISIEQFILTLTSFDSGFDRAVRGEGEFSEMEKKGFELFMTEYDPRLGLYGADCFHCHDGPFFTNHRFHNNGLKPTEDMGLEESTQKETDRHKFSTPSLRNVELTAPYMHDGRFATLEQVMAHYSSGIQKSATLDPNLSKHPDGGIPLTEDDQAALVAFLKTLTDFRFKSSPVALKN
jgi:cytochrome c peroxidase